MRDIPDDKLLSELSIPGTHNSYALHGGLDVLGLYSVCQSWTGREQLENGIRFFDLRLRPIIDKDGSSLMAIHHGIVFQEKYFEDVLNDLKNFLANNPSETILVRYRDETDGGTNEHLKPDCDCVFGEAFGTALESYKKGWLKSNSEFVYNNDSKITSSLQNFRHIPSLGDVRGKIVFINMDSHGDFGLSSTSLNIADQWDVSGCVQFLSFTDSCLKIKSIKDNLESASDNQDSLSLTFCSGTAIPVKSNRYIADHINPQVNKLVSEFSKDKNLGVVIFDYPTLDNIDSVIGHNDKLEDNKMPFYMPLLRLLIFA